MTHEELKRELKTKAKSITAWAEWFPFEEKGDNLIGEYTGEREFEDRPIFEVKDLEGKDWSVSGTVQLQQAFYKKVRPEIGDYVYIEYEGDGTSARGRTFKKFSMSKISKEDAKKLMKKEKVEEEIEEPEEKFECPECGKTLTSERGLRQHFSRVHKPKKKVERDVEKAVDFFSRVFEFYDEMTVDDMEERIKSRGLKAEVDDVIDSSDFLEKKEDKVVKVE